MKLLLCGNSRLWWVNCRAKMLMSMKLTIALILSASVQAYAFSGTAQTVTISKKNISLPQVFKEINRQTGLDVVYDMEVVKQAGKINLNVKNMPVADVLKICFAGQPFSFVQMAGTIVVKEKVPETVQAAGLPAPPVMARIKGKITGEGGKPLGAVTVVNKSTKKTVISNDNGEFEIDASAGDVLEFSSIGYHTQQVRVSSPNAAINVALTISAVEGEVVIVGVGYTTQEKHKLTSAVVSVTGDQLTKRVATDPASLLQGQLPGLSVVQNSAEPGNENVALRIRGVGTFSGAGTDPLIIVDGLPGNLSVINPNDIESVSVLKDAASAAIYGSRGANGVIVIKTKKGRGNGFSLTYNYNAGISTATRLPDLVHNSAQFMQLSNEAYSNSGLAPLYTQAQIDLYQNATDRNRYPNNDWLKDVFRTVTVQNHYLNLSGGKEGTNYSLGLGYTDQPGTMIGFTYRKYTLSLGLSSKVNKRVTLGSNIQVRYGNKISPEDGSTDFYASTLAQSPLAKPQLDNGLWIKSAYPNEANNKNPVAIAQNSLTLAPDYYGQGNLSLDVDIIKGLRWENRAGINFDANKYNTFAPVVPMYYSHDTSSAGRLDDGTPGLYVGRSDNIYTTFYSQLTYKHSFGEHNVSLLGGVQQEHNVGSNIDATRTQFATNQLRELNAGPASGQTNDGTSFQWAIRSYYGSANYDYDDRFLFGSSIRYDGTSRLPANSRWGLFYSFSGGWRISKEFFLRDISWLDDWKIRASWGKLGNQNIGYYPYQAVLTNSSYAFAGNVTTGFTARTLTDPSLTWETTRVFDLGTDITLFHNKLNISGDYFNKYTFNILRSSQVPLWLGLNAPTINNGAVRNTGFELSVQYRDRVGKDIQYFVGANFQHYKNKLVSFGNPEIGGNTIMENGQPINSYYMYVKDGIFQTQDEINKSATQTPAPTPGDIKYKDVNNDGVIDANDRTVVSGMYPDFEYSFNTGASWKRFDISVQLYGSHGMKLYMDKWGVDPFTQGSMPTTDWLNAWTPAHPSTTMPKIYVGFNYPKITSVASTYYLKDGSFMRIKNVQVGYTIPGKTIKGIQSLRVYFSGDNLALFSPLKWVDPERINNRGDGWYGFVNYPQNRTFTFGASIQF